MNEVKQKPKVIIIGAGISGFSCAVSLLRHCDVTMLEARDRVGGRINTCRFEDDFFYENGAQWIHGSTQNSLKSFVDRSTILASPYDENVRCLFESHEATGVEHQVLDFAFERFKDVLEDAANGINVVSSKNLLSYVERNWPFSNVDYFSSLHNSILHFQTVEDGCGSLEKITAKDYGTYEWGYMDDNTTVDYGMDEITNKLEKLLPKGTVQCNKKVTKVKWNGINVRVTVEDLKCGEVSFFDADFVVCTLPLEVLKDVHEDMFVPRLPVKKTSAIKRLGFGSVAKVILRFKPDDLLACERDTMFFLLRSSEFKYGNYYVKVSRCPGNNESFMTAWLSGKGAEIAEKTETDTLIKEFWTDLKKFMPRLPRPVSAHVSGWTRDEFTKGCYAYISSRSSAEDIISLAEPLYRTSSNSSDVPTVLFAGEATSTTQHSTMNGEFESGLREAERIKNVIVKL